MGFFKSDKEKNTKDLRLSEYNQIWSKFCFFDESGSLSNLMDPFNAKIIGFFGILFKIF